MPSDRHRTSKETVLTPNVISSKLPMSSAPMILTWQRNRAAVTLSRGLSSYTVLLQLASCRKSERPYSSLPRLWVGYWQIGTVSEHHCPQLGTTSMLHHSYMSFRDKGSDAFIISRNLFKTYEGVEPQKAFHKKVHCSFVILAKKCKYLSCLSIGEYTQIWHVHTMRTNWNK